MTTPPFDNPQLDILEMNETFEDINGSFGFAVTLVVYRMNGELYHGVLKARYYPSTIVSPADLTNIIQIPSAYSPLYTTELTRAQEPSTKDTHVKLPRLNSYDRIYKSHPNAIAESLLTEAKVCELLLPHPHPNIAIYHGCQVSVDRISGLCFTKYSHTLMKEVNPSALMKRQARSTQKTSKDYSGVLAGVESGIRHLHSLGLAHNDINPSNIMFDGDELVIIDLGSCRSIGEGRGGGTYEWCDEKVQLSPENDSNALEIRIWLGDDLAVQFKA
jgi:serine/threonine protein kinase